MEDSISIQPKELEGLDKSLWVVFNSLYYEGQKDPTFLQELDVLEFLQPLIDKHIGISWAEIKDLHPTEMTQDTLRDLVKLYEEVKPYLGVIK